MHVCLFANTLGYTSGGHLWVYLNWALGFRAGGHRVTWLETVPPHLSIAETRAQVEALRCELAAYDLGNELALTSSTGGPLAPPLLDRCLDLDAASEADLLVSMRYDADVAVVRRFRRSALVDIDPGLLQIWVSQGQIVLAPYDVYFSTGENVGTPAGRCPDAGIQWNHAPPCVALDWWPVAGTTATNAAFTTISHWSGDEWVVHAGETYINDKRAGFEPFFRLPQRVRQRLELALCLADDEDEDRTLLRELGWHIRESGDVAATPRDYQRYIQTSRGEFSCVKPSCIRLQNAWVSDRTLCYLASGKPAVVQDTGPSRILPDCAGLARFRDLDQAADRLARIDADYEHHSRLARRLVEEHFDARVVAAGVLQRALP